LGSLDPTTEERREGEKGKEGSLGWGVQALLFSTLSTGTGESSEHNARTTLTSNTEVKAITFVPESDK